MHLKLVSGRKGNGPNMKRLNDRLRMDSLTNRQSEILKIVQERGFAPIEVLSQHFQVTPQTIRRDINKLCKHGMLRRYHGGAGLSSSVENVDYSARKGMLHEEKQRIANLVASHVPDRASMFINLGTTTEEVAMALTERKRLKVITNNLNVAMIMSANEDSEVILAGGMVRTRDKGITGEATVDFIRQFKVDYGIIGVSGIDEDGTLLDYDYHEVRVAREIIRNSRQVYLVADHTKFTRNAMVRIGSLSEIDALFTDKRPPKKLRDLLIREDVTLHLAGDTED